MDKQIVSGVCVCVCVCVHAKLLQLCPTLCSPMDCSPPGSSVRGILQARILEWIAVPSSSGSSWPGMKPVSLSSPALAGRFFTISATWEGYVYINEYLQPLLFLSLPSHVRLFATPWTVAWQASLSLTTSWSSPKFMATEPVMPSKRLILSPSSPSAFLLSHHQGLFQWVGCSYQMAIVLELQLQHQSFQWVFRNVLL